jgi:hypothetical protein
MSRWAETFAALSAAHDTIDTSDKRSGAARATAPCVATVKTVETIARGGATPAKPAETLGNEGDPEPCVPCVTSVNGGAGEGEIGRPKTPLAAHDTSATLLTQGAAPAAPGGPTLLRDGRRLYRFRAPEGPMAQSGDAADLVDKARWCGAVLVADGRELIVVERWLSTLPNETLCALKENAGSMIAALLGESRKRCAAAIGPTTAAGASR